MISAALGLSVVLIVVAVALRILAGTWLHPAAFFAGWWSLAGIIPLIAAPDEPVAPGAILWVIAAAIAVAA
ncbi:MAG: hypothetical protein ABIS03_08155, partial [Gemmatimonadaceae bacterium]